MLANLDPVTKYTRLVPLALARQIEGEARNALRRCTRDEAASLTAELLSCYPEITQARRNLDEERQFQAYTVKLFEAFEQFSYAIGKALVHAGTGLPSTLTYRPKPADVIAAGLKAKQRFENILTMAERHITEAERRKRDEGEEVVVSPDERARVVAGFKACMAKLRALPDPIPPRSMNGKEFRPLGNISPPSQAADPAFLASLVASHDAGMAYLAERRKGK